ncbi:hypothetical protein HPB47_021020 [Ixodes persulcatus]|uniref:Uncharacterized protein n=1 Tax=Ixodes persulcatus TaxID=34615 RepID=A0AC60QDZ3_IXOPE|nr:hypothetical protein HPB47_021020 [Ixodes persulcatus]
MARESASADEDARRKEGGGVKDVAVHAAAARSMGAEESVLTVPVSPAETVVLSRSGTLRRSRKNAFHAPVETHGGAHKVMTGIVNMGCGL